MLCRGCGLAKFDRITLLYEPIPALNVVGLTAAAHPASVREGFSQTPRVGAHTGSICGVPQVVPQCVTTVVPTALFLSTMSEPLLPSENEERTRE